MIVMPDSHSTFSLQRSVVPDKYKGFPRYEKDLSVCTRWLGAPHAAQGVRGIPFCKGPDPTALYRHTYAKAHQQVSDHDLCSARKTSVEEWEGEQTEVWRLHHSSSAT